jgi:hypothetical protein
MNEDSFTCDVCGKTLHIMSKTMHSMNCTKPRVYLSPTNPSENVKEKEIELESLEPGSSEHENDEIVPAMKEEDETWACEVCTLLNPVMILECNACLTPRSNDVNMSASANADVNVSSNLCPAQAVLTTSNGRSKRTIEVCLIRHAQSEQNVIFYEFLHMIISIFVKREWPKSPIFQTLKNFVGLLGADDDAPLASLGRRQVLDMQMILKSKKFWITEFPPDICAWSPLQRARDTLFGILGDKNWEEAFLRSESGLNNSDGHGDGHNSSGNMPKFMMLESLVEATPAEHVPIEYMRRDFHNRIKTYHNWMCKQAINKDINRIVVCGHSQYFKIMLKQKVLFRNNDVHKVKFTVEYDENTQEIIDGVWGQPELLYRTQLAPIHPFDELNGRGHGNDTDTNTQSTNHNNNNNIRRTNDGKSIRTDGVNNSSNLDPNPEIEVINDLTTSDGTNMLKQCRICQATNEEEPELAHSFIRPCKCRGSQAFVHISCLNQWRSTSENAERVCSVCQHTYQIRENALVLFIKSDKGITLITILTIIFSIVVLGVISQYISNQFTSKHKYGFDLNIWLYEIMSLYIDKNGGNEGPIKVMNRFNKKTRNNWLIFWRYCKEAKTNEHEQFFRVLNSHIPLTLLQKIKFYFYGFSRSIVRTISNKDIINKIKANTGSSSKYVLNSLDDPSQICQQVVENGIKVMEDCVPSYESTFFCNNSLSSSIDTLYLGICAMALCGFFHYIYKKINRIYIFYRQTGGFDEHELMYIASISLGIYGYWSSIGGRRVLAIFGALYLFREMVYNSIRQIIFNKASRLGETILNYEVESRPEP